MALVDYLYVDQKRLDSYVEQIGSPVKFDKVPIWKAELGLFGPKAKVDQEQQARPLTTHEKIKLLVDYLERESLLSRIRPYSWHETAIKDFVLETCLAAKIEIPGEHDNSKLTLWLSPEPSTPSQDNLVKAQMLWLLENDARDDSEVGESSGQTAFCVLQELVNSLPNSAKNSIVGETLRKGIATFGVSREEMQREKSIVEHPLRVLKAMGAKKRSERKIEVLYRIRQLGPELSEQSTLSAFGYPLFVRSK